MRLAGPSHKYRFSPRGLPVIVGALALILTACQPIQPVTAPDTPLAIVEASDKPAALDAKAVASIEAARLAPVAAETSARLARTLPQPVSQAELGGMELNPFLQIFPELRQAPAPEWLHEGVRVSYAVQSAMFENDPDDKDPSGGGYMQYDVVALDRRSVVSSLKFIMDEGGGVLTPSIVTPSYGIPGAGDYWIARQALAHAEDASAANLAVVRMPTTLNGQSFAAVRFQSEDDKATYVWMYDEVTGVLLFHRYDVRNAAGDTAQAGQLVFAGMRDLNLPWRATRLPAWAKAGATLSYEGSYSTAIPGSPAMVLPYAIQVEVRQAKRRWFEYDLTDFVAGRYNSTSRRVNGVAQATDTLWLPPRGMARLEVGQVIDEDPITGFVTRVEEVRDDVIVLRASGPAHNTWATFDRESGLLLSTTTALQSGIATIQIEARLTAQTP